MLTEYEAAVLTRRRMNGCDRRLYSRPIVLVTTAIGLLFVGAFALPAFERLPASRSGPNEIADVEPMARLTLEGEATQIHLEPKAGPEDPGINSQTANGQKNSKFIFGFLEFELDPDMPGGVPGFGSWPPSASQLEVATARR